MTLFPYTTLFRSQSLSLWHSSCHSHSRLSRGNFQEPLPFSFYTPLQDLFFFSSSFLLLILFLFLFLLLFLLYTALVSRSLLSIRNQWLVLFVQLDSSSYLISFRDFPGEWTTTKKERRERIENRKEKECKPIKREKRGVPGRQQTREIQQIEQNKRRQQRNSQEYRPRGRRKKITRLEQEERREELTDLVVKLAGSRRTRPLGRSCRLKSRDRRR